VSKLQKHMARIGRREGPGIGFARAAREQPRAMLLGVLVSKAAAAGAAFEAGVDAVIAGSDDAKARLDVIKGAAGKERIVGAKVASLDEAAAKALSEAGCDFVISTLDGTASAAVNGEQMGQLIEANPEMDDSTLRALAGLGLEGLYVEREAGPMTLAGQLKLVRLSSFSSCPLIATSSVDAGVPELRVLRDSGTAMIVAPEGTTAAQLKELGERLRAVPPPRKQGREGREVALVPSVSAHDREHEEGDDDDE
jgi:hypothetical protein